MRLLLKACVIVAALGALGLGLLALRQQRFEASHQIALAHNRGIEQERSLWRMRAEVARRSDPQDIRAAAEKLNLDPVPIQDRSAPDADARSAPRSATGAANQASSAKRTGEPTRGR